MSDGGDEIMADSHADDARLPLSENELRVLELWDRLQELTLEIAILNAQSEQLGKQSISNGSANPETDDPAAAQNALLEARAKYKLRNDAIEAVMMATPILKAVHNGTQASPAELDLLPFVQARDETAISMAAKATDMAKLRDEVTKARVEGIRASGENTALTAQLVELAGRTQRGAASQVEDPEARDELEALERDVKVSRQRWRVMKGVASGIIAGSGVDWARDDDLRDIVLDPESED